MRFALILLVWTSCIYAQEGQLQQLLQKLENPDAIARRAVMKELEELAHPLSIPTLTKLLKIDEDTQVRELAAKILGKIGDQKAIPSLLKAMGDGERKVQEMAIWAMVQIGKPQTQIRLALIKALTDHRIKDYATWALKKMGLFTRDAVPSLKIALRDKNVLLRRYAAGQLRDLGPIADGAIKDLVETIEDQDDQVRIRVSRALGAIGSPKGVPALGKVINDPVKKVKENAIWALARIQKPAGEISTILIKALQDKDHQISDYARWALKQIEKGRKKSIPALLKALKDSDEKTRRYAARTLGDMGKKAKIALVDLITAIKNKDSDRDVRELLVRALGKIADPFGLSALALALEDTDVKIRRKAIWAIIAIGQTNEDSLKALIAAFSDRSPKVQREAALALLQLKKLKEALSGLGNLLKSSDSDRRRTAAWLLGELRSREAIGILVTATADDDLRVQYTAIQALGKIGFPAVAVLAKLLSHENPFMSSTAMRGLKKMAKGIKNASLAAEFKSALSSKDAKRLKELARKLGK